MKKIAPKEYIFLTLCGFFILGLFNDHHYRSISSVSLIFLVIYACYEYTTQHRWNNLFDSKSFRYACGFFIAYIGFSFAAIPEDIDFLKHSVLIKAPLILFPFIFLSLPPLDSKHIKWLIYLYILFLCLSSLYSVHYYVTHPKEVHILYIQSRAIPTVVNHVRFSSMLTLGIMLCFHYLFHKKKTTRSTIERIFLTFSLLFLTGFIHLLAVRSGLFALYIILAAYLTTEVIVKKSWKLMIYTIVITLILGVVSVTTIPTVRIKIHNTIVDLQKASTNQDTDKYSLAGRKVSYQMGIKLLKENPLFGTGAGNIRIETEKMYDKHLPSLEKKHLPHNQYLRWFVEFGGIGSIFILVCYYFPFFYRKALFKSSIIFIHFSIFNLSFMAEATLETQLGCNFVAFFTYFFLWQHGLLGRLKPDTKE